MYRMASIESAEFTAIPTFLPSQVELSEPIESLWHLGPWNAVLSKTPFKILYPWALNHPTPSISHACAKLAAYHLIWWCRNKIMPVIWRSAPFWFYSDPFPAFQRSKFIERTHVHAAGTSQPLSPYMFYRFLIFCDFRHVHATSSSNPLPPHVLQIPTPVYSRQSPIRANNKSTFNVLPLQSDFSPKRFGWSIL